MSGRAIGDVGFEDVVSAAGRIAGVAHRTPVMRSSAIDRLVGAEVHFKCENFQRVGAFKFRGAYNALSRLSDAEKARGVLTYSSGNHAQAAALAGRLLGIRTVIVMPTDAPAVKLAATRGYLDESAGSRIVEYDKDVVTRESLGGKLAEEGGLVLVPPYDHPHVIAGQGTAGMELLEETGGLDWLFVPCGGGGLLSGCAISARAIAPECRLVGVEPEAADDATRSFQSGELQSVHNPDTIADGARTPSLGQWTFPLVLANVDEMMTVSDTELIAAMRLVWERMKIVIEPTAALGLAGALKTAAAEASALRGKRLGIVISGGNVDLDALASLLAAR